MKTARAFRTQNPEFRTQNPKLNIKMEAHMTHFKRWTRGFALLACGVFGLGLIARATLIFPPDTGLTLEGHGQDHRTDHRAMGHFVNQNLGEPWTLATALAGEASGERIMLELPEAYTPDPASLDDYHCFLIDPKLSRDAMVTGRCPPGLACH